MNLVKMRCPCFDMPCVEVKPCAMGTNIMFWNCQGTGSKRKELELYLEENNFDIVALIEAFLTKKVDFKIQGYDTIKNDHSTGT